MGGSLVETLARKMGVSCQAAWLVVEVAKVVASPLDHLFPFLSRTDVALLVLAFAVQIVILFGVCLLSGLSGIGANADVWAGWKGER